MHLEGNTYRIPPTPKPQNAGSPPFLSSFSYRLVVVFTVS